MSRENFDGWKDLEFKRMKKELAEIKVRVPMLYVIQRKGGGEVVRLIADQVEGNKFYLEEKLVAMFSDIEYFFDLRNYNLAKNKIQEIFYGFDDDNE